MSCVYKLLELFRMYEHDGPTDLGVVCAPLGIIVLFYPPLEIIGTTRI